MKIILRFYKFVIITIILILENKNLYAHPKANKQISSLQHPISVYNLNTLNSGFKTLTIENGKLLFDDSFINDYSQEPYYHNGQPVTLTDCADLDKMDIRELTQINYSDATILRRLKRSCYTINHFLGNNQKLELQKPIESNNLFHPKLINAILNNLSHNAQGHNKYTCLAINHTSTYEFECKLKGADGDSEEAIFITPIFRNNQMTYFFVTEQYARISDEYAFGFNNVNQLIYKYQQLK